MACILRDKRSGSRSLSELRTPSTHNSYSQLMRGDMEAMKDYSNATLVKIEAEAYEKQQRHFTKWLNRLVSDVANEMGVTLTKIQYIDGRRLGCRDAHLLKLGADGNLVSTIIHEGELGMEEGSDRTERAKCKIRGLLTKLRQQADSQ